MKLVSIEEFLEQRGDKRNYGTIDVYKTAASTMNYLIFCAENKKRITYKVLMASAGVPEEYLTYHQLGRVSNRILDSIYNYCNAFNLPQLVVLCVGAVSGLPSEEGVSDLIAEYKATHPAMNTASFKDIVAQISREAEAYSWATVKKVNGLPAIPKNANISLYSNVSRKVVEEIEDEVRENTRTELRKSFASHGFREMKNTGRIMAILMLAFGGAIAIDTVYNGKVMEFSIAWLLWIPMCLLTWNAANIIEMLKVDFFDRSKLHKDA